MQFGLVGVVAGATYLSYGGEREGVLTNFINK